MKRKRIIALLISFLFSLSSLLTCYAEEGTDVNIGSKDPFWANNYASEIERISTRCARISLVKTSDNTIVDRLNICDAPYSESKKYNVVSKMTKMEIANYNGEIPPVIEQSIAKGYTGADIMYPEQVSLPQLIIEKGQSVASFSDSLTNWFNNKDNTNNILMCFGGDEEFQKLWNNKELCLLIEPMIAIVETSSSFIIFTKHETSIFTCAEVGVMSNNGCRFETTGSKNYDESMYKALPFSCFKVSEGLITSIPPYDISSSNGFCTTSEDYIDMIECLGCFELATKGEAPPPVAVAREPKEIEYYTNTWVITGTYVSSTRGFPYQSHTPRTNEDLDAKNNCLNGNLARITYSFDSTEELDLETYTQSLAIPENGTAITWVKWKTPSYPCNVSLHIQSNSSDARLEDTDIEFNIIDPEYNTYPPNTEGTDRNDYFTVPNIAKGSWDLGEKTSLSWSTYNYNWHYYWVWGCSRTRDEDGDLTEYGYSSDWDDDYVCDAHTCPENSENHTCPTGRCHGVKQDWGWVEWTEVKHTASLNVDNIDLKRSSHSPNTNNSDYSIKSGYGIELDLDTQINNKVGGSTKTINSDNSEMTPPQFMETYLPEYKFEDYEIVSKKNLDENYTANNHFNFPINPYSQFEQNCHFTPIWYPDGKYVVGIRVSQCWTPAGMLYKCIYDTSIDINGNAYDDWHIRPEMN